MAAYQAPPSLGFSRKEHWSGLPFPSPRVSVQFSSVAQSCPTLRPHESQHARPPCPSPTPGVHSDWRPLSQWWHPAISSSVVPFSSCPQSLPASKSFPMSQLFASKGLVGSKFFSLNYFCCLLFWFTLSEVTDMKKIWLFHNTKLCCYKQRCHYQKDKN